MSAVRHARLDLDAPVGRYLPELIPGERGEKITVRMPLNHISGIADYILYALSAWEKRRVGSARMSRPISLL
ncbi:serine hydrolase [Streptosporangium sp. NPDC051023]|uniref:serine hydrolase n=1 Tax=Streptosporangium sp. NPDC051023 TaxID=3155410 RepID=UPI00344CDB2D